MAITSGLQRDYTALIDKKLRLSMDYIKAGQMWSAACWPRILPLTTRI